MNKEKKKNIAIQIKILFVWWLPEDGEMFNRV